MLFPSVKWMFEVNAIMNIVHAHAVESNPAMQSYIIHSAVNLIEKAQKHNGIPYESRPFTASKDIFIVHFSLIFKTPNDIKSFFEQLQNEK